jgi:hypothetical protein
MTLTLAVIQIAQRSLEEHNSNPSRLQTFDGKTGQVVGGVSDDLDRVNSLDEMLAGVLDHTRFANMAKKAASSQRQ